MAQTFDPYRTLGVRRDATEADVKAAHRRLAKRFHPDAQGGDRDRFLRVQEAYKVLSDPLLRREWDSSHAPGPMRADRPSPASPAARQRTPRRPARPARAEEASNAAGREAPEPEAPNRRPRSSRAYTWSAAEVPWWEEGTSENRRQPGRNRPAKPSAKARPSSEPPTGAQSDAPPDAPNAFDVYNRSSGAAWSMAARAYFRRGDQDLPRRGTFQYEGTQVLTGARARTAAAAEARRRQHEKPRRQPAAAAAAAAPGAGAFTYTAAGVSHDAHRIHQVRQSWQRRTNAATWPSLRERLLYGLLAWVPAAIVIGYGGAVATGCDAAAIGCPRYLETAQAVSIALVLGVFVALPKLAYLGAMATIGALLFGLAVVVFMMLWGVPVPLSLEMTALLGGSLAAAYAASAGIVVLRDRSTRPW